jgi:hypothetical protein
MFGVIYAFPAFLVVASSSFSLSLSLSLSTILFSYVVLLNIIQQQTPPYSLVFRVVMLSSRVIDSKHLSP